MLHPTISKLGLSFQAMTGHIDGAKDPAEAAAAEIKSNSYTDLSSPCKSSASADRGPALVK
jgi:hypothetical protein